MADNCGKHYFLRSQKVTSNDLLITNILYLRNDTDFFLVKHFKDQIGI